MKVMSSSTVPNPISSIIERLNQVESYVHVFANKTNDKLANQASVLKFLSDDLIQFNHESFETNSDFERTMRSNQLRILQNERGHVLLKSEVNKELRSLKQISSENYNILNDKIEALKNVHNEIQRKIFYVEEKLHVVDEEIPIHQHVPDERTSVYVEGIQASESTFKFVQPQSKVEVGGSVHSTKLEDTMQKVLGLLQSNQKSGYMYKNYPKTSEWPTFDGKRDSDWVTFLIKIDAFKLSYKVPDEEVTSKLISILTGVAGVWYQAVLPSHPNCSWEEWKQMITKKFAGYT